MAEPAPPATGTADYLKALISAALAGKQLGDANGPYPDYAPFPTGPGYSPLQNQIRRTIGDTALIPLHILSAYQRGIGIPFGNAAAVPEGQQPTSPSPISQEDFNSRFEQPPPALPDLTTPMGGATDQNAAISALGGLGGRPSGPDYSETDKLLEEARPQAQDPARRDDLMRRLVLQGLASGAAQVDTSEPGSIGKVLAAAGAGAAEGKTKGLQYDIEGDEAEKRRTEDYAMKMAGVKEDRAKEAATRAAAAWAEGRPKVIHADGDNVVIMAPNPKTGQFEIQSIPVGSALDGAKKIYQTYKGLGAVDEVANIAKYGVLQESNNLPAYKLQMIRDLIASGQGEQVFGEAYTSHLKDAQAENTPSGKPDFDQEQIEKKVAAGLLQDLDGNDDWVTAAAQAGNIGAIQLLNSLGE